MKNETQNPEIEAVETPETEPQTVETAPVHNPADWVTENFSWREMTRSQTAARRGIDNTPNAEQRKNILYTAQQLEKIRAYVAQKFGAPRVVMVSSGFRSLTLNRAIGGSTTSAHVHGLAADFDIQGLTSAQTAKIVKEMKDKGLIDYDQLILEYPTRGDGAWVHIGFKAGGKGHRRQELTANRVNGKTVYSAGLQA
ncbi:D-Ala-D-Ala carboxypeptidase family metallohydrolase [Conchiformibius steedae]|uniref:ATP-binding protein n=1 Tax=Conchiformibius steedae TaxID=153493 RepID=A0A3P2A7J2_9NEIS|nr:D-Ala-D-Ala carboxypeptidase family metallohydrolase [Conchiformibius steedae]RRD91462.1 ATP-binding protein [Conchiformibius steedae]